MQATATQQFLEGYKAAVYQQDLEAFCRLYAADVSVFDAWGGPWFSEGLASLRASTEQWFTSLGDERVLVSESEVHSSAAESLAVAHGIWRFAAVSREGKELRWLENRFSDSLRLESGGWKVFHQHTSSPAEFGSGKVQLRRPQSAA
jgi:ketosteroid isomerase-like protein